VSCRAWVVSREEQRVHGHGEIVDASGTVLVEADCHMQVLDPERAKKFLRDETVQKLGDRGPGTRALEERHRKGYERAPVSPGELELLVRQRRRCGPGRPRAGR
jgi:hypothetical protein